jgi:hypothetical protein
MYTRGEGCEVDYEKAFKLFMVLCFVTLADPTTLVRVIILIVCRPLVGKDRKVQSTIWPSALRKVGIRPNRHDV